MKEAQVGNPELNVRIDTRESAGALCLRNHGLGQGRLDDAPFPDTGVERLKVLRPPMVHIFLFIAATARRFAECDFRIERKKVRGTFSVRVISR